MLNKEFVVRKPVTDPAQFEGMPKLLARIYAARAVNSAQELKYDLKGMVSPGLFSEQLEVAVDRLCYAMSEQQSILVVGDFDVDGATSTALLVSCLREMGANNVNYLVPDRVTFGYGLSPELVAFAANVSPDLIITVDNGVSSIEGVAAANDLGIDVVVTDHHLPGAVLPDAVAIVNPNLVSESFPSKNLAGVGVVFYLLIALRQVLRESGWFEVQGLRVPNLAEYLDLVALGSVADVVPLDFNNRIFVRQGLQRIRKGACRPGITALFEVAGRSPVTSQASNLGFVVGPRLNAAGRLESMSLGIECLLATEADAAAAFAKELDEINIERRHIQADMQEQAEEILTKTAINESELPLAVCLYDRSWHQGVVGIVASKIKDQFHRPVIVFADGEDGSLKGSARSIPGIHIRDVLDRVASQNPGLITKFGGHAMAAGLSLDSEMFEQFQVALQQAVEAMSTPDLFEPVVLTDGKLEDSELAISTAQMLDAAGPWGQGFPEPLFQGEFTIRDKRVLKQKHLKMVLTPSKGKEEVDAIVFNTDVDRWPPVGETVSCTYRLSVNHFRGNSSLQLMIQDYVL